MAAHKPAASRYNIAEAKARFSELVQKAVLGEEVVIAKGNKPLLKLVPLEQPKQRRKPGSAKGQIWMAPDFDAITSDAPLAGHSRIPLVGRRCKGTSQEGACRHLQPRRTSACSVW